VADATKKLQISTLAIWNLQIFKSSVNLKNLSISLIVRCAHGNEIANASRRVLVFLDDVTLVLFAFSFALVDTKIYRATNDRRVFFLDRDNFVVRAARCSL
jgi:hypothetical protein